MSFLLDVVTLPQHMSSPKISLVKNIFDQQPQTVDLADVFAMIQSPTLTSQTARLRKLSARDPAKYRREKGQLPAAIFAGVFSQRGNAYCQTSSGLMIVDLDHLSDAASVKELVAADQYVRAAFISPSGTGVKFLVAIPQTTDPDVYAHIFTQVSQYFADVYGLECDMACSDIVRLCFLCHDETIIINESCQTFDARMTPDAPVDAPEDAPAAIHNDNDPAFRDAVLTVLQECGANLFADYRDFRSLLFACKREGVSYDVFDRICQRSDGYDASENAKAWSRFDPAKAASRRITFGTLYDYANRADHDRLTALLRAIPQPECLWDDDAILAAARRDPQAIDVPHVTIRDDQYISDVGIPIPAVGETIDVYARPAMGKSAAVAAAAHARRDLRFVMIMPTMPLRTAFCHDFPQFAEVCEGDSFDGERLTCTTQAKFAKTYAMTASDTETVFVLDESQTLQTDADPDYRLADVNRLAAKLRGCRVVKLTGTPVRFPHHTHRAVAIRRETERPLPATLLKYADTYAVIHDITRQNAADGLVPAFFITSINVIKKAAVLLQNLLDLKTGEKRPYCIYRDPDTQDMSEDARTLALTGHADRLPDDCLCILSTPLFEVGLNIDAANVGDVVIFPRQKQHDTAHGARKCYNEIEAAQTASRFRRGFRTLYIAWAAQTRLERADWSYDREFADITAKAEALRDAYNLQVRADRYFRHVKAIRDAIAPEHQQYIMPSDGGFICNSDGIDNLLLEGRRYAMTHDPVFFAKCLAECYTPIQITAIETHAARRTADERAFLQETGERLKADDQEAWEQELTRLADPAEPLQEDGRVSQCEKWVARLAAYLGREKAVSVVRGIGRDMAALSLFDKWTKLEVYRRGAVKVDTFEQITALLQSRTEWESSLFAEKLKPILRQDKYLRTMLTGDSVAVRWTPHRAAKIMSLFARRGAGKVLRVDGQVRRVYTIESYTPLQDAVLKHTGTPLNECVEFTQFCAKATAVKARQTGKDSRKTLLHFSEKGVYTLDEKCNTEERAAIMAFGG